MVLSSMLGMLVRGQHAQSHLLTIHLQDVGLEQLLMAGGMAGVIAHVDGGHLGDVEGVVLSEVLHGTRKTKRLASLLRWLASSQENRDQSVVRDLLTAWLLVQLELPQGCTGLGSRNSLSSVLLAQTLYIHVSPCSPSL